jgi:hypothetical protein
MRASKAREQAGETNERPSSESIRTTVNLLPKSADALDELQRITGLSKTDIINRSIQMFALFKGFEQEGAKLAIKRGDELTELYIM